MLKIEAGKYYKTRDGEKVLVTEVDGYGVAWYTKQHQTTACFTERTEGGRKTGWTDSTGTKPADIVAEWTASGPIQEISEKRLIAGNYGIVKVEDGIFGQTPWFSIYIDERDPTAEKVLAAGKLLTEIGEFLKEKK